MKKPNLSKYSMESIIEVLTVIFLTSLSVWLISYYTMVIGKEIFYTHFIYIPAILSAVWWGKRGSINAFFLGFFLILSDMSADVGDEKVLLHLSQVFIFIIVTMITGIISDERIQALKEKEEFLQETAHYFLNPISIARGYIDLLLCDASSEREIMVATRIKEAVERIEEAVKNTVERRAIYEHKGDVSLK